METKLIQVAILWSISCLGIICAINARGLFRQLVSWLLVAVMATVAATFSYLKFEDYTQEIGIAQ
ncbi:MAG: hypothetical protein FWC26_02135, partial [Fibromonadales bacterium]|nr:hypothetical protein [Fibromonadales bacterium]